MSDIDEYTQENICITEMLKTRPKIGLNRCASFTLANVVGIFENVGIGDIVDIVDIVALLAFITKLTLLTLTSISTDMVVAM